MARWYTVHHWVETERKQQFLNITGLVEEAVRKAGIAEGMVLVSAMHITAGVFVNDEERGIKEDFLKWAEKIAPADLNYRHHHTGETNGDAHLKSVLFHHQVIVPVTAGKLDLGPWQQVFYAEFDGRRRKRIVLKVTGE